MANSDAAAGQVAGSEGEIVPFGKYLLLQRVSVGGMAEVFKALPAGATHIDQIVAIKRILPNISEDSEFIGMFVDEARIAGELTHPNICRIYELGRVGAEHYIAMQFLWGRDLLKVMNRFKKAGRLLPPPMAALIAQKACEALHYAHTKCDAQGRPLNIIHRDVSPQNIIVGYTGQVKLIDFGVARAASQSQKTQAGILKGKFGYMSPEMIRGQPVDHRADIFSIGICLHEALTAARLFLGESDFGTLELIRDAPIAPPSARAPNIPPALDAIVMKALSRDVATRYATAQEMARDLAAFLAAHAPGFNEASVGKVMREAFGYEVQRERFRLETFAQMLRDGELARGARVPAPPVTQAVPSGERSSPSQAPAPARTPASTTPPAGAPTREPPPDQENDDDLGEERTHIFFSAAEQEGVRSAGSDGPLFPFGTPRGARSTADVIANHGLASYPPLTGSSGFISGTYERRHASRDSAPGSQPQRRVAPHGFPTEHPSGARVARRSGRQRAAQVSIVLTAALSLGGFGYWAVHTQRPQTATLEVAGFEGMDTLVRIDGAVRGMAPLALTDLAPGAHTVELLSRGAAVAEASVVVQAGETRRLELDLDPNEPQGDAVRRAVSTGNTEEDPPQADQEPTTTESRTAPHRGARPVRRVQRGKQAAPPSATPAQDALEAQAAPDVPAGEVAGSSLEALMADAVSGLEGRSAQASNQPATDSPAPPAAEAEGGAASADPPAPAPRAAAAGQGALLISTQPWSRVYIDGVDTGRDTPIRALPVPAGVHEIGLQTPDGVMHNVEVTVEVGKVLRIVRRF